MVVSFRSFRRRNSAAPFACLLLCLTFTPNRAAADTIYATSYNTPSGSGFEGGPVFTTLEQQFTLTTAVTISSIDAALAYTFNTPFPAADLTMEIVDDSSGTFGSTVYATDTGDSGTLGESLPDNSSSYSDINFTFGSVTLDPGTYWMVLTVSPLGNLFQWEYQVPGTINPSGSGGVIDALNGYGGTYNSGYTFLTTINGGSAPEPVTSLTAFGALVVLWAIRHRRRESDSTQHSDVPASQRNLRG